MVLDRLAVSIGIKRNHSSIRTENGLGFRYYESIYYTYNFTICPRDCSSLPSFILFFFWMDSYVTLLFRYIAFSRRKEKQLYGI